MPMITRASKADGRSTAGQRARHAGVAAVTALTDLMTKK